MKNITAHSSEKRYKEFETCNVLTMTYRVGML